MQYSCQSIYNTYSILAMRDQCLLLTQSLFFLALSNLSRRQILFENPEIIYPCGVSFSCAYRVKSLKVLSNRNKSSRSFQSSSYDLQIQTLLSLPRAEMLYFCHYDCHVSPSMPTMQNLACDLLQANVHILRELLYNSAMSTN